MAGCKTSDPSLFAIPLPPAKFQGFDTLPLWAKPWVFEYPRNDPYKIDGANLDRFIPGNSAYVLISPDAYRIGLFQRSSTSLRWDGRNRADSPAGTGYAESSTIVSNGTIHQVLIVNDSNSSELLSLWTKGRFARIIWSPSGVHLSINEVYSSGQGGRVLIIEAAQRRILDIKYRCPDIAELLEPLRLEYAFTSQIQEWLSANLVRIWIYGPPSNSGSSYEWGVDLVLDITAREGTTNCRVLRGFRIE